MWGGRSRPPLLNLVFGVQDTGVYDLGVSDESTENGARAFKSRSRTKATDRQECRLHTARAYSFPECSGLGPGSGKSVSEDFSRGS